MNTNKTTARGRIISVLRRHGREYAADEFIRNGSTTVSVGHLVNVRVSPSNTRPGKWLVRMDWPAIKDEDASGAYRFARILNDATMLADELENAIPQEQRV